MFTIVCMVNKIARDLLFVIRNKSCLTFNDSERVIDLIIFVYYI